MSSSRQQPVATPYVATPHLDPYHLVDVEVQLKPGCHDIMLQGKVGVVSKVSAKMATVQIRENSSDITIPTNSLKPVPARPFDTVKVIGGSEAVLGFVGTLVSTIGNDGVVQFISINRQRKRNPAQIPLSQLGRYSPKSKFPSAVPSGSVSFFPKSLANCGPVSTSTLGGAGVGSGGERTPQMLVPLQLYPVSTLGSLFPLSSSLPLFTSSLTSSSISPSARWTTTHSNSSSSSGSHNAIPSSQGNLFRLFDRTVESVTPDSTTGKGWGLHVEQDSGRMQSRGSSGGFIGTHKGLELTASRFPSGISLPRSQHQSIPRGQLPTLPDFLVKNVHPNHRGLFFVNQLGRPRVVNQVGGGGASGSSNGYSISEVLDKLVKNQRAYVYELTSPTTPGELYCTVVY